MKSFFRHLGILFAKIFFCNALGIITFLSFFNNEFGLFLQKAGLPGLITLFLACLIIALICTIVKIKGSFEIKKIFPDTTEMDKYFAKRVAKAKKEVCSLMWQDDTREKDQFNSDRKERQDNIKKAISLFCGKGHIYREVFTFSFTKRFDIMKDRLGLGTNYQCRYYDNFDLEIKDRFPKLQFRIIDDKEVIFASRRYGRAICAIKDPELVKIMQIYFDFVWENALEISNSNSQTQLDTVNKLEALVLKYREKIDQA